MQEYQKFRAKQLTEGVCSFLVFVLKGWGWDAFQSFMSHLSSYCGICHDILNQQQQQVNGFLGGIMV